jgi:hypothetical protein
MSGWRVIATSLIQVGNILNKTDEVYLERGHWECQYEHTSAAANQDTPVCEQLGTIWVCPNCCLLWSTQVTEWQLEWKVRFESTHYHSSMTSKNGQSEHLPHMVCYCTGLHTSNFAIKMCPWGVFLRILNLYMSIFYLCNQVKLEKRDMPPNILLHH